MEPLFFREEKDKLYGVFHRGITHDRNSGVIICNPFGYEYMRAHRTLHTLANKLANLGFDVLRFDFYGCGDSSGELYQTNINHWYDDINLAVETLRNSKKYENVILIGNRLGASLALKTCELRNDIQTLILWDPIIKGTDYLKELRNFHNEWMIQSFSFGNKKNNDENELLGYEINRTLLSDLKNLDLLEVNTFNFDKLLYLCTMSNEPYPEFHESLKNNIPDFTFEHLPGNYSWEKQKDDENNYIIPLELINLITNWTEKVEPNY